MDEEKKKELRRVCSMTESLFYGLDELMGKMEIEDEHGFDVLPEDEEAFIAIGDFYDILDDYRWKLKDILEEKIGTKCATGTIWTRKKLLRY